MKKIQVPPETGKSMFCLFFFSIFLSCFHVCFPELSSTQTNTMIELSRFLNIPDWNLPGSERNPCSWEGVDCSRPDSSSVISLSLSGFDLSNSSFLPLVCQIQTLESLDVSNNSLSSIPDGFMTNCGTLVGLKQLNFSGNQVSSFPGFRNFSKLEVLDISHNRLSGNIGDYGFDALVQLKNLSLNFNKLAGSVPTDLAKSLVNLEVSDNLLSGSIPEGIEEYQELRLIDLSDNQLNGSLPSSLGNLSKLETLLLSNNNLKGAIPESLSRIQTLSRFAANRNGFTGAIPSGITKHVENLDLSFNLVNGSIPDDLLSQPKLVSVDLSSNLLVGWLPQRISHSLVRLRLGSNKLTGSVSSGAFEWLQNLTYLEMDNNGLTGHIPPAFGNLVSLNLLNLEMNQFTGILPPSLGNITSLQVLKLQQNKLTGEIPDEMGSLSKLLILDLSWNSLSGSIPSSLSNLMKLTNMKLQGNKLSGAIPDSIGDLSSLLELQLGQNQLRGRIPIMPPKLQISLNLSTNMFQGPIPSTLSQLGLLEVLDLSNNKFSGEIPGFLASLISLRQLVLSNNQLIGNIPKFTHNVSISVTGNPAITTGDHGVVIPGRPSGKKSQLVLIVTLVAVGVTALVAVIIILKLYRRFKGVNNMQVDLDEEEGSTVLPEVIHGKLLTSNSLHKSNINFAKAVEAVAHPENALFQTMFWSYYRVLMPSGSSYFIKKLNTRERLFQQASSEQLEQDLEMLGKLHHSNVMVPLAYVLYSQGVLLFYEFAHTHSLHDVLHNHPSDVVDWTSRYSIAVGIAQGICYLHGSSSNARDPVLVPDLSSKKIMLKSLTEPLVADIELFKVIDPSRSNSSLSAVAGTIGYIPPEYAYTMRVTMAGNVYSFGVILLELLTGKPAVSEGRELSKWVQSQQEQRNNILDLRVSKSSPVATKQMIRALSIALACINISPGARPKMKTVLRMLTRL
ncbi:leucine-rich repeat receptor-like serine/threonine-protein kinase At1g17230 isoform X1 [Brassica rapa]|uniref:leucine-rich repeat receptor-like serine/threonine-protein kinase At1g17230 isoform X1 n=1 Tax=Brassica campestris TaxID=3711 RepID=UPI0004F1A010|nr:leucine-rich repeat receptor-like serine/threonine-protein kinase At1g17230 isoform X1 [Brassica rapa]XP_033132308.1 leucine-rich repeat receptor-like serine/threonine-protein kinase At1g17230 isoform X1 [Brassica rapa]